MEDAGLDENVAEHTQVVDGIHGDNDNSQEEDHNAHSQEVTLNKTRWYFASAVFPMVAGTLGPVASAFSICALVKHWRQHILPGSDVTKAVFIDDPPWLLAINSVQLVIAVVANVFLLLNMTKRVRFSIAQPVTIVGWYVSSILLIALCATASGPLLLKPEIEYVWSQAFYYGLFAAILYFIIASLMVITVWGAHAGHYPKDFELTISQRTLMLQTILFLVYLLLGALVFSHIEGWLYLDAVYWADVTLFTVGLGDVAIQTNLGRGLMIPYALIGITTLGLVIGSIRSLMLDRGKSRLDARMLEKKRRRFVRRLMRTEKGKVLVPVTDHDADYYPYSESNDSKAELERRHKEFQLMRKIQDQASKRRRWAALGVSTGSWAVLWLVGAKIFQISEAPYQNWSYFDGIYFSFQAMTTIGYGDFTPVSNSAKAFFVFWSLLALPTLTILISNAGDTIVKEVRDATVLLGNITILPGESGYKTDIRQFLSKLSLGVLFTEENIQELPPGFLGAAQPHTDKEEDGEESIDEESFSPEDQDNETVKSGTGNCVSQDPSSAEPKGLNKRDRDSASSKSKDIKDKTKRPEKKRKEPLVGLGVPDGLPKSRAEYHLVLIDEIRRVSQHLQHSPPRKYTYQEWTWYLRLIGEDESDALAHRIPLKKPESVETETVPQPAEGRGADGNNANSQQSRPKWSWVGHRSPLMDTREEAEWILDKLSQKLRQELQAAVEEREGDDGVENAEAMEEKNHDWKKSGDDLV
ncbi:voltage-gated potassium channel [Xylariaceae sp. AK1471]|nr:voltage-gated potassium channel [Xylariaceae sp. AK1471]